MRKALVLFVAILAIHPVIAQQQSLGEAAAKNKASAQTRKSASAPAAKAIPAGAPSREDVLKLFALLRIQKTMESAIVATKQQSMELAEQMIQERMPDATAEQKKQFREAIEDIMSKSLGPATIKEMLDATVPVYQRHLTKGDLDAMVAFYSSPVGQKILQEQPAMVQESMEASSGIQQRIARGMFQKIDERVEEMVEAEKERSKKP